MQHTHIYKYREISVYTNFFILICNTVSGNMLQFYDLFFLSCFIVFVSSLPPIFLSLAFYSFFTLLVYIWVKFYGDPPYQEK